MNTPKVNPEVNLPSATHTTEPYGPPFHVAWKQPEPPVNQVPQIIGNPMQSPQVEKLSEALAKAQGQIRNPTKNKKVIVRTKTGGTYEFEYADLAAIIDAVKKPLADNGISYVQLLEQSEDGKYRLRTQVMHAGQWIVSLTPLLVQEQGSQAFGSALTFMKRYALSGLLGVAADSDDDANAADGNAAKIEDKPLTPEQVEHLLILINGVPAILDRLLTYVSKLTKQKIEKLEDIPQSQFPTAFAALSKKVKAPTP